MAKRFTFADAKEKIKQLEAQVDDLQGIISEEFADAKEDIADDVRSWGWGDTVIALGAFLIGVGVTIIYVALT